MIALKTLIFSIMVPGAVAGVIPWLLLQGMGASVVGLGFGRRPMSTIYNRPKLAAATHLFDEGKMSISYRPTREYVLCHQWRSDCMPRWKCGKLSQDSVGCLIERTNLRILRIVSPTRGST